MLSPSSAESTENSRRDRAVAIDKRRSEKTCDHEYRAPLCLFPEQRHQRQYAALAIIVDAHGDGDVFDGGDQKQRPNQQRKNAENALGRRLSANEFERGLERIERA